MKHIDHAILRAYNNPNIEEVISQIYSVVDNIIVVINGPAEQEKGFNTRDLLNNSKYFEKITPVVLEDYGWSKALNAGLRFSEPKNDFETRLMISNEVVVNLGQLEEMQEQVLRGKDATLSCFGSFVDKSPPFTAGSYGLFEGRREPTYLLPRNTCTLWRSKAIEGFYFNEKLDGQQGMEDVYMGLKVYEKRNLLPSLGPTNLKVHIREGVDLNQKTIAEQETIGNYLKDFNPETVKAYFGAINVLNISKGEGGVPIFPELWVRE